jgi:hypothetical protein
MISEPPPKSIQFARVQTAATLLASDVLAKGYARENVAQALVRVAQKRTGFRPRTAPDSPAPTLRGGFRPL